MTDHPDMALIPLMVAIPLLAAAVLAAGSRFIPRIIADCISILAAAALAILAGVLAWKVSRDGTLVYWFGGWHPRPGGVAIGIAFVADPLATALAAFIGFLGTAALIFSWRYLESAGTLFHALVLVFLGAMAGFCLSGDLFTMFVFFELMGTAAFALTGHKIESDSLEGALNFAIINSLGGFLIFWGIGFLYGHTGALNLAQLGRAMQAAAPPAGWAVTGFALIACGYLVKAAMVPFHFWLADAHAVAPTPVCLLFSGIMVELGLYGVGRVYWAVFAGATASRLHALHGVLLALAVLTAILGAVMCTRQRHLKRMLAFSTISHAGIMLGSIVTFSSLGFGGAILYIFAHGLVKGALFLCAGILLHRLHTVDQPSLRGRGRMMPLTGVLFTLGGLGLAGLPPFGTFLGKGMMDESMHQQHEEWAVWAFSLAVVLTGGAVLRSAGWIFMGWGPKHLETETTPTNQERPETRSGRKHTPVSMIATPAGLLAAALVLGAWNGPAGWLQKAAICTMNTAGYQAVVLDGASSFQPADAPGGFISRHTLAPGLVTALLAMAFAAWTLFRDHLPGFSNDKLKKITHPPLLWLGRLHSGNVCDYAVWLTGGMAALGILFGLALR